jgi:hypothetical protein
MLISTTGTRYGTTRITLLVLGLPGTHFIWLSLAGHCIGHNIQIYQFPMSVISFAVIGKSRIPLYLQEFDGTSALDSISNEDNAALFGLSKTASELPRDGGTSSKAMDSSKTNKNNMICSVQQQFILHDALDRLEQRVLLQQPPVEPVNPNATANDAMFLGLLCPVDDMRVYGTCCILFGNVSNAAFIFANEHIICS